MTATALGLKRESRLVRLIGPPGADVGGNWPGKSAGLGFQ